MRTAKTYKEIVVSCPGHGEEEWGMAGERGELCRARSSRCGRPVCPLQDEVQGRLRCIWGRRVWLLRYFYLVDLIVILSSSESR